MTTLKQCDCNSADAGVGKRLRNKSRNRMESSLQGWGKCHRGCSIRQEEKSTFEGEGRERQDYGAPPGRDQGQAKEKNMKRLL